VISSDDTRAAHPITLATFDDYDLAMTLHSGQAFRWEPCRGGWGGVIGSRWVRLEQASPSSRWITAETATPPGDGLWLTHYLQTQVRLQPILDTFPVDDPHLRAAVQACRGLRLLRQDPWECLASFILSSTKQIVQIRQIVGRLCQRFGQPVPTPPGYPVAHTFPGPETIAQLPESDLRACKAGFRASALRAAAIKVSDGSLPLSGLGSWPTARARECLMQLHGVGEKIANCVLLFAFGKPDAFPLDVWVRRALTELYFPGRNVKPSELSGFARAHFGPHAGYAQQFLFHYARVHRRLAPARRS
jgi:N-glycosylase/DNA lyase